MNTKRHILEKLVIGFLKALISATFTVVEGWCWINCFNDDVPMPYYRLGHYFMLALILASYIAISKVYGAFEIGTSSATDIAFSQIITVFIWQIVCYVMFTLVSHKLLGIEIFAVMFVLFSAFGTVWAVLSDRIYYVLHKPKRTIVVYGNIDSYLSLKGIRNMDRRFNVVKTYNADKISLDELCKKIYDVDAVFLCGVPSEYRNEVVKFCVANDRVAYIKPKISDTIIRGAQTIQLLNIPIYRCRRAGSSYSYLFVKRIMDIVFSLVGIIVLSPLMLITSLAVKLYDGGPIFYMQQRYTKDKKLFNVIKFRSMRVDAEKDGVARLASENDDRITPVGKVLRKLRLDEMPQLFNILNGSMSVVGPRPERPEIFEQYEKEMPEFALRLQVKAGLTGYAQVYGKYNTPPYDKVQMDLTYIANQSLAEDIKLMLLTFKIMFVSDSTEGVKDGQVTADRKTK